MSKPSVIITGKNAGHWYIQTLESLRGSNSSFDYDAVTVDFEPINALLPYKLNEAAKLLEPYFAALENRKQPYILANITLHEALNYFSFVPKYFISIEAVLKKEAQKKLGKVVVLGTKFTMNNRYIPDFLSGAEIITLPAPLQDDVDDLRIAYFHSSDVDKAKQVFRHLNELEIDTYIIACTELALALKDGGVELNALHLPYLQCQYLVQSQ